MTANLDTIFSPADVAGLTETYLERRRTAKQAGGLEVGMPVYIKSLDSKEGSDEGLVPVQDTDLAVIISRPGHGKSSLLMRWARMRSQEIRRRAALGDQDAQRRVVVYATWEQSIEALNSFHIAATNQELGLSITRMAKGEIDDRQWEGIQTASVMRVADPLWFIGTSIERRKQNRNLILNTKVLEENLWEIENWQGSERFRVDSVFVDYLQAIPWHHTQDGNRPESKTVGISLNMERLKDTAKSICTKMIAGCQAKADCDKRDDPTPRMEDGEWTAGIEQRADVVITAVRPCKYREQGKLFNEVPVRGYKQMLLTVAKQKVGESNFCAWVNFDPRYNKLDEAELKRIDFTEHYSDKD